MLLADCLTSTCLQTSMFADAPIMLVALPSPSCRPPPVSPYCTAPRASRWWSASSLTCAAATSLLCRTRRCRALTARPWWTSGCGSTLRALQQRCTSLCKGHRCVVALCCAMLCLELRTPVVARQHTDSLSAEPSCQGLLAIHPNIYFACTAAARSLGVRLLLPAFFCMPQL